MFTVLLLAVSLTAGGLPGVVLCIGADGHFSIESAHEGQCQGEVDSHAHDGHAAVEFVAEADADCCGECTDVPLSSDGELQPARLLRNSYAAGSDLPVFHHAFSTTAQRVKIGPSAAARSVTAPRVAAVVLAQRTVVLRI
jgi:hypothetical protein